MISRFSEVYWFIGDPCDYSVLTAAGLRYSYHLPLLSSGKKRVTISREKIYEADMITYEQNILDVAEVDYDHVTTLLGLYEVKDLSGVTAEIKNISNCRFLRPEYAFSTVITGRVSSLEKLYQFFFQECAYFMSPLFAAGYIFHASIIDRAVAQSWYNPYIISVFRTLIGGEGQFSVKRGSSEVSAPSKIERPMDTLSFIMEKKRHSKFEKRHHFSETMEKETNLNVENGSGEKASEDKDKTMGEGEAAGLSTQPFLKHV